MKYFMHKDASIKMNYVGAFKSLNLLNNLEVWSKYIAWQTM